MAKKFGDTYVGGIIKDNPSGFFGFFNTLFEGFLPNYRGSNRYSVNLPAGYSMFPSNVNVSHPQAELPQQNNTLLYIILGLVVVVLLVFLFSNRGGK